MFILLILLLYFTDERDILFGQQRQQQTVLLDSSLITYSTGNRHYVNNDYKIEVRKEGGEWEQLVGYYAINMNKGPFRGQH